MVAFKDILLQEAKIELPDSLLDTNSHKKLNVHITFFLLKKIYNTVPLG